MGVSIIVPVYNGEHCVGRCIESILNQTFEDFELILVNDGSSDKSGDICESYARKDSRIKVIHKENGGSSSARNRGLMEATKQYIQFVDCDDTLCENALAVEMSNIDSDTDLLMFGFNIYKNAVLLRTPNPGKHNIEVTTEKYNEFCEIEELIVSVCNKLYSRNAIKVFFDTTLVYSEDRVFNYSNLFYGIKIKTISDCLYNVTLDTEDSVNKRSVSGKNHAVLHGMQVTYEKRCEIFGVELCEKSKTKQNYDDAIKLSYSIEKCILNGKSFFEAECNEIINHSYFNELCKNKKYYRVHEKILFSLLENKRIAVSKIYLYIIHSLRYLLERIKK